MSAFHWLDDALSETSSFRHNIVRAADSLLVACEPELVDGIRRRFPVGSGAPLEVVPVTDRAELVRAAGVRHRCFVFGARELELVSELRELFRSAVPALRVFGLANHYLPFCLSAPAPGGFPPVGDETLATAPGPLFAIVCNPRTGSQLLSGALQDARLGAPAEHLRPVVLRLLRERRAYQFSATEFADTVYRSTVVNGHFGTKLISNFAFDALDLLEPDEVRYFQALLPKFRFVYLYRRDRLLEALSLFRSQTTGVYHVSAGGTAPPAAQQTPYDYDRIAALDAFLRDRENRLLRGLRFAPRVLPVCYEEMVKAFDSTVNRVAGFLGVEGPVAVSARYQQVRGEDTHAVATRFEDEFRHRRGVPLSRYFVVRDIDWAVGAVRAAEPADRPGTPPASMPGPYQQRHWELVNYRNWPLDGTDHWVRGPRPPSLEPGTYFAAVGAAQTFGACVAEPFPTILGALLGVPALNLGAGGAEPEFFLRNPNLLRYIAGARVVVVQVMAARMANNSEFENHGGMNLVRFRSAPPETPLMDAATAWAQILKTCPAARVRELVAESQESWVRSTRALAETIPGRKILFWFSEREPEYRIDYGSVAGIFGTFPQMIDRSMIGRVKGGFDAYVECVGRRGLPQVLRNRFTGRPQSFVFGGGRPEEQTSEAHNNYYPSPEMHLDAAAALAPALERCLGANAEFLRALEGQVGPPGAPPVTLPATHPGVRPAPVHLKRRLLAGLRGVVDVLLRRGRK